MTSNLPANPFGGSVTITNAQAMAEAMQQSAAKGARGGAPDGSTYLNFSGKRGVYEFGQDKENVDPSELWLVNIASIEDGYVCWKGGSPIDSRMSNIYNGAVIPTPSNDEHGPFNAKNGEGWFAAKSMVLKSLDEDDKQGYFRINSKSGVSTFADLQDAAAARMATARPYWPVIRLDTEKFQAQGNWNYKPKFEIYGWLSDEAVAELAQDSDADIDELIEMSSNGGKPQVAAEPEPVAEEPAPEPAGRRRRRSSL